MVFPSRNTGYTWLERAVPNVTDMTTSSFDPAIWRLADDDLMPQVSSGPLGGARVAVKDLFAIAGQPIGAGNPTFLAGAPLQDRNARVVDDLMRAGATVVGITRTDEFAYSLAGTNPHYGTPPNAVCPDRVPGGSSSGSAAAVALGLADIGLGTDTGGSIRVPAAYQGLWGIRTTHGAVSHEGVHGLAPSFDTVGWLTRDPTLLEAVGKVLLPLAAGRSFETILVDDRLLDAADPDVAAAARAFLAGPLPLAVRRIVVGAEEEGWPLEEWRRVFVTIQGHEAWAEHGAWVSAHPGALGEAVAARFRFASTITDAERDKALAARRRIARTVRRTIGDDLLAVPSAASVPPLRDGADPAVGPARAATLSLTCIAGLSGLPALAIPLRTAEGLPCGLTLVGPPGSDRDLLALGRRIGSATAEDGGAPVKEGL